LFEMLTGKVPFGGEGYGEIIVKHITHQAPSARRINPAISASVEMILYRSLMKEREKRFQTMQDLRKALLAPEAYVTGAPALELPAELTGVTRMAAPMSRGDMPAAAMRATPPPVDEPAVDRNTPPPSPSSTFRHAVGQVEKSLTQPESQRKMVLAILAGVAIAVVTLSILGRLFKEPDHTARMEAATRTLRDSEKTPATVRLSFASDPDGAIVTRESDGTELGVTPLSIEVAYSNSPDKFVLRKPGYLPKMLFVVPNLPVPLFAALQPEVKTSEVEPAVPQRTRGKSSPRKPSKTDEQESKNAQKADHKPLPLDGDAVLEPDFK